MWIKTYSEKAERAFQQHEKVREILNQKDSKQDKYIKDRIASLKKTKEMVSHEKE